MKCWWKSGFWRQPNIMHNWVWWRKVLKKKFFQCLFDPSGVNGAKLEEAFKFLEEQEAKVWKCYMGEIKLTSDEFLVSTNDASWFLFHHSALERFITEPIQTSLFPQQMDAAHDSQRVDHSWRPGSTNSLFWTNFLSS